LENILILAVGTTVVGIATHLITKWRGNIKAEQLKEKIDDCYVLIGQQDVEKSILQQACAKLKLEHTINTVNMN
jgi:hypothetical protein